MMSSFGPRLLAIVGIGSAFVVTTAFSTDRGRTRMDSTLSVSFSPAATVSPTAADYNAGTTTGARIIAVNYTINCGAQNCTGVVTPTLPITGPGTTNVRYSTSPAGPFTALTAATSFATASKATVNGTFYLQFTLSWTATKPGTYTLPVRFDLNT